jgi:aryl-alcohol dehydrogenase-like predicted oxidoreductase
VELVDRDAGRVDPLKRFATKVRGPMSDAASAGTGDVNNVGLSRKHILASCDASLSRLGTDYIDLYQIHGWDELTPLDETMRALDDLMRHGKVRHIGCSNLTAWQIMKANGIAVRAGGTPFWTRPSHGWRCLGCFDSRASAPSSSARRS